MKAIALITLCALSLVFCFVEQNTIGIWFFAGFLSCMTGCAIWGFLKGWTDSFVYKGDIMLTQEMLNETMVRPGEQRGGPKHKPMSCPACHEAYLGNGVVMCVDCEIERKESVECPVKDSGRVE